MRRMRYVVTSLKTEGPHAQDPGAASRTEGNPWQRANKRSRETLLPQPQGTAVSQQLRMYIRADFPPVPLGFKSKTSLKVTDLH